MPINKVYTTTHGVILPNDTPYYPPLLLLLLAGTASKNPTCINF